MPLQARFGGGDLVAFVAGPLKRLLIGPALRSETQSAQLLPKWLALPVFSSDTISSVAYATEQILLVAGLGGAAYLSLATPVAAAVAVLLAIVVLSYRQICHAYPNGGGAFAVSQDNLGEKSALTAAAALMVDYVMTVAVSVVAGVLAITSKFPSLQPHAAELSVAVVAPVPVMPISHTSEALAPTTGVQRRSPSGEGSGVGMLGQRTSSSAKVVSWVRLPLSVS